MVQKISNVSPPRIWSISMASISLCDIAQALGMAVDGALQVALSAVPFGSLVEKIVSMAFGI